LQSTTRSVNSQHALGRVSHAPRGRVLKGPQSDRAGACQVLRLTR